MSDFQFELTEKNYYTDEANKRYMSVHQYFDFIGTMGTIGCEERALARLRGDFTEEPTLPMLVGSYVDSYFEGTLDEYRENHPETIATKGKTKGELKVPYKQADTMIERCEKDEYFMKFLSGEKQKIFTAELFGCEWKCKLDSYIPGKAIVDLKTSANIHKAWRVADYGYCSFIEYYGYTTQLAVYQKIVDICTGEKLPCYIAVVTKEDSPEIAVINIPQVVLDDALEKVRVNMPTVLAVKNGEIEPTRCERCDWCKATKKLTKPILMADLINEV